MASSTETPPAGYGSEDEALPPISDAELADRLKQLNDELIHIGYRIPTLAREACVLRRHVLGRAGESSGGDGEGRVADPGESGHRSHPG